MIFNKFARGSNAREHRIQGAGIGLTMVCHIVEAHGGKITLISAPGTGSTFTIQLPVRG
jgi:signal transduction histidine kinase